RKFKVSHLSGPVLIFNLAWRYSKSEQFFCNDGLFVSRKLISMFRPLRFWSQLTLGQKRVSQRRSFFLTTFLKLCA
ncbi:hypothetical protein, partial [Vibrio parahaemolyticus]|uniref:hypothetical protein n=1 Tax=Vibrio parahaemolyticus TaxID=670 RepID=UPI001C60B569